MTKRNHTQKQRWDCDNVRSKQKSSTVSVSCQCCREILIKSEAVNWMCERHRMYHVCVCVWKFLWASSRLNEYVSCQGIRKSVGTKNLLSLSKIHTKKTTQYFSCNIQQMILIILKRSPFSHFTKATSFLSWCWLTGCWCFFICFHSYFMVCLLSSSFRIIRRCCVHFFFSLFDVVFFFLLLSFFRLSIFSSICCCCCCICLHLFYYSMDFAGWIK